MQWKITPDRPVYLQLVEHLELAVVSGEYPPGGKVPSVRELAADAAVNPNTMQRALQELEAKGIVTTQRTAGRTITEDIGMVDALKENLAQTQIILFLQGMHRLGYTKADVFRLLQDAEFFDEAEIKETDNREEAL